MRPAAASAMGTITLGIAVLTASGHARPQADGSKPVSFAILEDYDKGDDLGEVDADFRLYEELEIRTWRGSFGWDDYEPSRGRYEFAWLRQFAELARRRGVTLRPYVGYTPEWAAGTGSADKDVWNDPPGSLDRWQRFTSALARELRPYPHVASFEIYNEENVKQWWDGDARQYASTLVRGARGIRQGNPGAAVLFGGMVYPDGDWVEAVCGVRGAPGSFSVLPFHAYPETWTPPDVTVENYLGGLADFIETADAACGRKAIWINETGFATVPGKSERDQATWWVRAVATFLAAPRIEHIGVYEIKDLPLGEAVIGDAPNYHLGLTRVDRTRKLAFYTVDMLTDLLDTGSLTVADEQVRVTLASGETTDGGARHAHLFVRPDGDRVLFVWDREAASTVRIQVPGPVGSVTEYQLDGKPTVHADGGGFLSSVTLARGEPRIFRLRTGRPGKE
jgi:hypothetical protein